jgi:hypothetical protein
MNPAGFVRNPRCPPAASPRPVDDPATDRKRLLLLQSSRSLHSVPRAVRTRKTHPARHLAGRTTKPPLRCRFGE